MENWLENNYLKVIIMHGFIFQMNVLWQISKDSFFGLVSPSSLNYDYDQIGRMSFHVITTWACFKKTQGIFQNSPTSYGICLQIMSLNPAAYTLRPDLV